MECVMNFPCLGKVELIHDGRENHDDYEGSFLFRGEFGIGDGGFEVSGCQPDFIAFSERGESSVIT